MTPLGLSAAISAAGISNGTMTEYTLHSRMRRAMTCVYCEPKSRMTICSVIEAGEFGAVREVGEKIILGKYPTDNAEQSTPSSNVYQSRLRASWSRVFSSGRS